MNVKNFICGLGSGVFLSIAFSLLLVNKSFFIISEYLPVFLGAFFGGIVTKKTVVIGISISIVLIFLSFLSLYFVVMSTSGKFEMLILDYKILLQWAFYLPIAVIGAYSGKSVGKVKIREIVRNKGND